MASKKTINVITYGVLTLAGAGSIILPSELGVPTTLAQPAIQTPVKPAPSLKAEATENLARNEQQSDTQEESDESPWR